MNERFAKVREILSETPSEEGWAALLKELRAWPAFDDKDMGIEYLDAHLANWPDELRALNQLNESPYWRFIRCYHIDQKMKNVTLQKRLMNHPMLQDITTLRISVGGFVDHLLPSVFFSKMLPQLRTLILENRRFGDSFCDHVQRVLEAMSYPEPANEVKDLRLLDCGENVFKALEGLALFPGLAGLEHLTITRGSDQVHSMMSGLRPLFQQDCFPALKSLQIQHGTFVDEELKTFGQGGLCEHLVSLSLIRCPMPAERLTALMADASGTWALREFHLSGCFLCTEGCHILAKARCLQDAEVYISDTLVHPQTRQWLEKHNASPERVGPRVFVS